MQLTKAKTIVGIITGLITIVGAIFLIEAYFAKSGDVDEKFKEVKVERTLIQQRLDISISDDQVFQQQQRVKRVGDLRYEKKEREMTEEEEKELTELIEEEKKELRKLEKRREKKIERYEQSK